jgi:hypothetical protein
MTSGMVTAIVWREGSRAGVHNMVLRMVLETFP